jgi:hypothetical protein
MGCRCTYERECVFYCPVLVLDFNFPEHLPVYIGVWS